MKKPLISMILARADNGVIGADGKLPWHLPADLKRFKALTVGKSVIMGRKTFESFAKLLPDRRHIVLTRDLDWQAEGAEVVHDIDSALARAGTAIIWVIGGAEIYRLFEPLADRIELTEIHLDADGDTIIEVFDSETWRETAREDHDAKDKKPAYSFVTLIRKIT